MLQKQVNKNDAALMFEVIEENFIKKKLTYKKLVVMISFYFIRHTIIVERN